MNFSNRYRRQIRSVLERTHFDVLIIGGGITGAGIALDAASRGIKTALVEMQDFSAGTSSRSTKLIHGGLRYLKQWEIKMVAEVGKERAIVHENGPHVTKPQWMLLPIYGGEKIGRRAMSFGLRLYDFLAGVNKNERRKMLSREETLKKVPLLKKEELLGAGYYVEYRTDDARLTIEVLKEAVAQGAIALNYVKAVSFLYKNERIIGANAVDQLTGSEFAIHAKVIVNAAGPWVDQVIGKDMAEKGRRLQLTKGVHIVIDQSRFPLKQAVYFHVADGRMVFAIPREKKVYIGTTDTFCEHVTNTPQATSDDRNYLLNALNKMFPEIALTDEDIETHWAGLRPLIFQEGKDPSEISRKDEIWESESGLLSIAGGKLTGYRKMAEAVVDRIAKKLGQMTKQKYGKCRTKTMPISGGHVGGSKQFRKFVAGHLPRGIGLGLQKEEAQLISLFYGSNVEKVYDVLEAELDKNPTPTLPLDLLARMLYAIEHEMAATPVDFFRRRTGLLLFDLPYVMKWKEAVISYMAIKLGWSLEETKKFADDLNMEIELATQVAKT
jgi:glycerol-3-phosphate dehydrogenase